MGHLGWGVWGLQHIINKGIALVEFVSPKTPNHSTSLTSSPTGGLKGGPKAGSVPRVGGQPTPPQWGNACLTRH